MIFFGVLLINQWFLTGLVIENTEIENNSIELVMFYGQGCPHCGGMKTFLTELKEKYPINVIEYEVYFNQSNRELFEEVSNSFGVDIQGVPTLFMDEKVFIGFSSAIGQDIEQEIKKCLEEGCVSPLNKITKENVTSIIGESSPEESPEKTQLKETVTIPAVLAAAAVDSINPCAFAVLIILMTTILVSKNRKKALLAGLAFTVSIYISYFLMGIGLYSAIQATGLSRIFCIIVAFLAILIGLFNLKDYLWYGKWFVMEVPLSWRPKLQCLIYGITSVPGAFLIGFAVSLFLLPCTSGPYIVILGLLANTTTRATALGLLLLYNLIFVIPMLLITGIISLGVITPEKAEKWRQKKLKVLHLIAGIIILLLGIGMLIALCLGMI